MDDSSDIGRPEIVVRQVVEGVHDLSTASLAWLSRERRQSTPSASVLAVEREPSTSWPANKKLPTPANRTKMGYPRPGWDVLPALFYSFCLREPKYFTYHTPSHLWTTREVLNKEGSLRVYRGGFFVEEGSWDGLFTPWEEFADVSSPAAKSLCELWSQ